MIVQSDRDARAFREALEDAGVDTHQVRVRGRDYRGERRAIAALCARTAPDILHSHGYRTDVVDGMYMRRCLPVVSTVHGFTGGDLRNRFYQWLQSRAYRGFDAVVAVSEPLHRQLIPRIGPGRLHLLPNAYEAEPSALSRAAARGLLGIPEDEFSIGWVGRLSIEKGADVLLEALAHSPLPTNARAVFLGDGPQATALHRKSAELGLEDRVRWKGFVPNAASTLAAFDVLVLSSRTEGTPMVLLEAMAAGTPIIATSVGGVPDVLPPDTALLVSNESPSALSAAILELLCNSGAAAKRAEAARHRLNLAYGVESWIDKYEAIYEQARIRAGQRLR